MRISDNLSIDRPGVGIRFVRDQSEIGKYFHLKTYRCYFIPDIREIGKYFQLKIHRLLYSCCYPPFWIENGGF